MKTFNKNVKTMCLGLAGLMSASVLADHDQQGDIRPVVGAIRLGTIGYGGSGCPQGSAQVEYLEESGQIALVFEEYAVSAGTIKTIERKNCSIALPLSLPSNLKVKMAGVELNGFAYLPSGAQARLAVESFFAGTKGPLFQKTLTNIQGPIRLRTDKRALGWSTCGANVNLRLNTSATLINRNRAEEAFVAIHTMEGVSSRYLIDLEVARCD